MACLRNKDLTVFTDVVNQGGGGKGDDAEKGRGGEEFPLPGDHWINRALEDEDDQTLLEAAIERGLHDFQVPVVLFCPTNFEETISRLTLLRCCCCCCCCRCRCCCCCCYCCCCFFFFFFFFFFFSSSSTTAAVVPVEVIAAAASAAAVVVAAATATAFVLLPPAFYQFRLSHYRMSCSASAPPPPTSTPSWVARPSTSPARRGTKRRSGCCSEMIEIKRTQGPCYR